MTSGYRQSTHFRHVCRGRIYASRAVYPLYRMIGTAAAGGIYAAPTSQPIRFIIVYGRGRGVPRPYQSIKTKSKVLELPRYYTFHRPGMWFFDTLITCTSPLSVFQSRCARTSASHAAGKASAARAVRVRHSPRRASGLGRVHSAASTNTGASTAGISMLNTACTA